MDEEIKEKTGQESPEAISPESTGQSTREETDGTGENQATNDSDSEDKESI